MTLDLHPNQNNSHGLSCDGCGIARDDLREIENMQTREDAMHELFQNAARIRGAMRTNGLLRPIFRKYQRACREILQQKKDEAEQMLLLCDYCDAHANDSKHLNHDLKCIQREMREIHNKTKSLEELQPSDSDSSSDSDEEDEAQEDEEDAEDEAQEDEEDAEDEAQEDAEDEEDSISSSSGSSLSDILDMENFA